MNKILITSPSLNESRNISGISSLVASIISSSKFHFEHFEIGSNYSEKKNMHWLSKNFSQFNHFLEKLKLNEYVVIHFNTAVMPLSVYRNVIYSLIAKKLFGKKIIQHIHGGKYLMVRPESRILFYAITKLLKSADLTIVLSNRESEAVSRIYGCKVVHILPNAVDLTLTKGAQPYGNGDRPLRIIFMGRIVKSKGIHVITKSMSYLQDCIDQFELEIYGTGPDLDEWKEELSQIQGLNFKYKGIAKGREKWNALERADIFLLPSIYGEGLPMALLEAMAAQCIVIVTDDASISSVVRDHENGLVIPKNDPLALAENLKKVLGNKIPINTMTTNARLHIENYNSLESYIDDLENLYQIHSFQNQSVP